MTPPELLSQYDPLAYAMELASRLAQTANIDVSAVLLKNFANPQWRLDEALSALAACYEHAGSAINVQFEEEEPMLMERQSVLAVVAMADNCLKYMCKSQPQSQVEMLLQSDKYSVRLMLMQPAKDSNPLNVNEQWLQDLRQFAGVWGGKFSAIGGTITNKLVITLAPSQSNIPGIEGTGLKTGLPTHNGAGLTLLLANRSVIFSESLAGLLANQGYRVAGLASNTRQLRLLAIQAHPHAILLDTHLDDGDTFELAREFKVQKPDLALLYLTGNSDSFAIQQAVDAGARAYLRNDISVAELFTALTQLQNIPFQISPAFASNYFVARTAEPTGMSRLSSLQIMIHGMTQQRLTNKEIAQRLNMSESNVKYHIKQILLALSFDKKGDLRK